ncbi:taste receptor type 2 member 143-like [Hyla sarda]|uniref:taste receptor type 2 member 143-like n=1 Tax=Hyla sarda TaxID=327740 RepID=UPI0024C2D420|nr:taste receptor type 2 member 143-like [Hyla sarda]
MPFTWWILLVIFGILDSVAAYILNMCILAASIQNLKTGERLNPPDLIHLVIGAVNIVFQCLLVSQGILTVFFTYLMFIREIFVPAMVSTLTLMYFIYWLTAWLCIYYCVTIPNFNHPLFVWSKRKISMYLPRLLLITAAGCFFISLPTIWIVNVNITQQSAGNSTCDPTVISGTFSFQPSYIQTASFIGCFLPFLLILVSNLMTGSSLLGHICKMRQNDSGLSQAKDQAHINAIRTIFRFISMSIIFYINAVLFFSVSINPEDPQIIVHWLIFMSFPTSQSLNIIYSNPKLRKHFVVKFPSFERKL